MKEMVLFVFLFFFLLFLTWASNVEMNHCQPGIFARFTDFITAHFKIALSYQPLYGI